MPRRFARRRFTADGTAHNAFGGTVPRRSTVTMGAWSLYFLAKLGLYYAHRIDLQWLANVGLALALALPLHRPGARRLRAALAIPAAIALTYHELHLPPWMQLIDDAAALANFRADYLLELARRAGLLQIVAALALLILAYTLLRHRLRFATLAFLGLAMAAILPPPAPAPATVPSRVYVRAGEPQEPQEPLSPFALDEVLRTFYGSEHGKTVNFARVGNARFDLVLLSVCSLSYDDLAYTHMREDPFLSRFDIIFRQFNTAATYSGPALLRLLHGTCGQTPQGKLYNATAADSCYLFRSLAAAGYQPALLLNHDGQFDHFAQQLREQGGMGIDPEDNRSSPVFMTAFDGKPLRADFDVLSRWWMRHQPDEAHNALLYNTISLHDGNRVAGQATRSSIDSYTPRLRRLFTDLSRFIDLVEASGRPTAIVLIPEHGAALRADAMQIAGLRELPTHAITNVPVAVKLVGFPLLRGAASAPLMVERPSSYLALTALIAGLTQLGPNEATPSALRSLVNALPATQWIAENEGTVLLQRAGRSYLRSPGGEWTDFVTATPP